MLLPSVIRLGGGLLKTYCKDIGCGSDRPADNNTRTPGHPDDNFDVSSRLIELEELDVTKQAWKDLYGRTGIKKGYNGLSLGKTVTAAYAELASKTTEAEFNTAAQQFQTVLDRAQKEAKHSFEDTYYASADVALLSDAFVDNAAELLLKRLKEPIREIKETFTSSVLLKNQPVLLIPSGALTGFNDSPTLKASLDEYVKQGGTLIVLSQKHGYDYASIPTPDGKPITGYGWEEDQNCFADSVAIESWHQLLSGQSRSTPTLNVDGYFTGYPANATVLLRRTANGQPAMLMYEHGLGRVIVTSMYSDWAYGHGQASQEEIALIRDLLSWAKKPASLPEVKPGETITVPVTLTNSTATDAASIKLQIWNPDRSTLLLEQAVSTAIPAGQSLVNNVTWQAPSSTVLGIYHIDYLLLDSSGAIIQPQAETDSGRFVVSSPPQTGALKKEIWLSITSPNQEVFFNEPFLYSFHIFNNSATTRTLTLKTLLPHTNRRQEYQLTATANGETVINGTDLFIDSYMFETLRAYLYDESGTEIGSYMLSFKGVYPQVTVTTTPDRGNYGRGASVALSVTLKNARSAATSAKLGLMITDPANSLVYSTKQDVTIDASGTAVVPLSFTLPVTAQGGVYTVATEVTDSSGTKIGGDAAAFELPLSSVVVTPQLPPTLVAGTNSLTFTLTNTGSLAVSNGTLEVALRDPDGAVAAATTVPFVREAGASGAVTALVTLPPLKFGTYTLQYSQSDETRSGKPASIPLANSIAVAATFDKPSYRIRETAHVSLQLTNSGRFTLENVIVTVAIPAAGYSSTEPVVLTPATGAVVQRAIALPDSLSAGEYPLTVILALQDGSTNTQSFTLAIPQSSVSTTLSPANYTAGATITPTFHNSGGVDTRLQYRLTLYDANAAVIVEKIATETVRAGGNLGAALVIPAGITAGEYRLVQSFQDIATAKADTVQTPITIAGVKAALQVRTDSPSYLSTTTIVGLSSIGNQGSELQEGRLHLQVTTDVGNLQEKRWTSQYDFQQGARDGVDTYGVNDWLIPDDDFAGATLDRDRWTPMGSVALTAGKVLADSAAGDAFLASNWHIEGDFDLQVDFEANNSVLSQGAELVMEMGTASVFIKNSRAEAYSSGIQVAGSTLSSHSSGTAATNGKFRMTRSGDTVVSYYWSGSAWLEVTRATHAELAAVAAVKFGMRQGAGVASAAFDNFAVNSGRLAIKRESVDSVRLLPINDNFDHGFINEDRWQIIGTLRPEVSTGTVTITSDQASWENGLVHRVGLPGDCSAVTKYRDYAAQPYEAIQGRYIMWLTTKNTNIYINRQSDRLSRASGQFLVALSNINGWYQMSGEVPYGSAAGLFRLRRQGNNGFADFRDGTGWNTLHSRWGLETTPATVKLTTWSQENMPTIKVGVDYFKTDQQKYTQNGTIRLKQDAGLVTTWQNISWNSTEPSGTSLKLRTRTAADEAGLVTAPWSDYLTASGSPITSAPDRWIEVEATLATTDTAATPLLHDVSVTYGRKPGDILWQADVPVNLVQGGRIDRSSTVGSIGAAGKYYLRGTLFSSTGQSIASAEYPFFVAQGNTLLTLSPDKRLYKPGETVTISGTLQNLSAAEATNLDFSLKSKYAGLDQPLYRNSYTLAAGASQPFTVTTVAGSDGETRLNVAVTQNSTVLAELADQYEVATPRVTAALAAPDMVGAEPFTLSLTLSNSGKTEASVTILSAITSLPETVTIPAGQTKLLQYQQQISADTVFVFTLSGDLTQTITKAIKYGPAVALAVSPQAIYPEGALALPITVTNSGLLDSQFLVTYQLAQGGTTSGQQTSSYFLAKGAARSDRLFFDLGEGTYQLTATSQAPSGSAAAAFQVRKEVKAELALTIGSQDSALLPLTVAVTNHGYSPIDGAIRVAFIGDNGATAWTASQDISLPQAANPAPRSLPFAVNLAALKPGSYTVRAELLDAGNRQLAAQSTPFILRGPAIAISQTPAERSVPAGGSSDFVFTVKNSGNQEGGFDLSFKADDLIDATRSGWLRPGEEQTVVFSLQTAADLEEKDYFASFGLKQAGAAQAERGTVKYRLQGINLAVTATLDRESYRDGDIATVTLQVARQDGGAPAELFARVNYNGYNGKKAFTLNGSQTLTFSVPLESISGEKLFYGIYAASGRSLHLNTIYIYKADGQLALATDRQVYTPGETVTVAISGSASGDLTLTGPGGFTTTFAYGGAASQSFTLPATMTAGTYTLRAQLNTSDSHLITAAHPFDVTGIQVKVKEALLDKTKYAATDTMQLSLAIESNRELAATVRTWIVDPTGSYTPAGESAANLTSAAPVLSTFNALLSTASLGIHKLVYGIYQGDLLLASGAKAFDIGAALLLGLAADRSDYPAVTMPVTVTAELYGSVAVGIDFLLDGASIKTDTVPLAGSGSYTVTIPPASLTPGLHILKAVVSVDGLTSSREIRFTYGSSLPDLVARVAVGAPQGGTAAVAVTVTNQGKTAANGSSTALYGGDPANGGQLLTTLAVPAITAGGAVTLSYNWNVLGRSGEHVLYAVADSDNAVVEFIEANNRAITATTLPAASLAILAGKSAFGANEAAVFTVTLANLSATLPLEGSVLKLCLTSAGGTVIDLPDRSIGTIIPATTATLTELWNTGLAAPADYSVAARLVAGGVEIATAGTSFTIAPTQALVGSIAPAVARIPQDGSLEAFFTVSNRGNIPFDGLLQGVVTDPNSGADLAIREVPLRMPLAGTQSGSFSFPLSGLPIKDYDLLFRFTASGGTAVVARSQFTIIDTLPPLLAVSALSDGSATNQEVLNLCGTVQDNSGIKELLLNGVAVPYNSDGSFSLPLLLTAGANAVEVKVFDLAGNSSSDRRTIILDQSAPRLTIASPADNSKTAVALLEVTGTVDETSTVQVRLGESVQSAAMNGTAFSAGVTLTPGGNTIEVTALDLAGNSSSQKRSVVYDDQKPSLAIVEPAQDLRTNRSSLTIAGTASDPYSAVGVTVALEGAILTPPVLNGNFSQIVSFGAEKLYPITVTATNEVGTQTVVPRNVIYDRTPPVLTINPVLSPTNTPNQVVTGTREEGTVVTASCTTATLGSVEYPAANAWQLTVAGLTQGENRLRAETTDLAGNLTTATATIQYVPRAPDVTISASPQTLWPPNKKLVAVIISGNLVTYGSDIREVSISVADEYGTYNQQGLKFGDTVLLEAWREGNDRDGRVYTITAVVTDQAGNRTARTTTVVVPHDLGE